MKTMDLQDILALIEAQVDVLSPAVRRRWEFFASLSCPDCGGGVVEERTSHSMAAAPVDGKTPYGRARCTACGSLFDPITGLICDIGSPAKAIEPIAILKEEK